MKRRSLFFIGLMSAIVTVISLNFAFGSSLHHNSFYSRYHHCDEKYDRRYDDSREYNHQRSDSSNSKY